MSHITQYLFLFIFLSHLLSRACEQGDSDMVRVLLDWNNDDTGVHMVTGQSPLYAACSQGHIECVQIILAVGILCTVDSAYIQPLLTSWLRVWLTEQAA